MTEEQFNALMRLTGSMILDAITISLGLPVTPEMEGHFREVFEECKSVLVPDEVQNFCRHCEHGDCNCAGGK